jgi:hypothetical protein
MTTANARNWILGFGIALTTAAFWGILPIALKVALGRNSPLAMRNPMFAIVMWNEVDTTAERNGASPVRGIEWAFSTRGRFSPLAINLGIRTVAIAPQTLRFIEPIRQLAIVDGSNQGLQLYDLQTLAAVRREPYL